LVLRGCAGRKGKAVQQLSTRRFGKAFDLTWREEKKEWLNTAVVATLRCRLLVGGLAEEPVCFVCY